MNFNHHKSESSGKLECALQFLLPTNTSKTPGGSYKANLHGIISGDLNPILQLQLGKGCGIASGFQSCTFVNNRKKKREIKSVWLTKAYVKYKVNSVYIPCQNWQQENTKNCLKNFRSIRNSWKPAHYRGYLLRASQRWLWWQVIKKLKLLPYMGNYVQFTNFIGLLNLDKTGWETAYRQHKKHDEIYFCVTMLISRPPVELVIGLTINRQPPYRFIKVKPHNRTWSKSTIFFLLQSHFIPSSSPLKKELMKHRNGVNILTDLLIFKSFE